MIARVIHAEKRSGAAVWGATAVFPRGVRPASLELYAAAYAGDGAELTGLQVLDEFETVSGPVILAPATELGLVYDVALTHAFERDAELSLGSGWPPVVIGFDARAARDPRALAVEAADAEGLFREAAGAPVSVGACGAGLVATAFGRRGGFGAAAADLGGAGLEAFALLAGGLARDLAPHLATGPAADLPKMPENPHGANVAVLVTDAELGPRALRRLAGAALAGLASVGWCSRTLALAVSSAAPVVEGAGARQRRPLGGSALPPGAEGAVIAAVARAAESAFSK